MTEIGKVQQAMDKIWAQPDTAVAKVCANATGMAALVAIQSTIQGFGYAAVNASQDYSVWNGKKVFIQIGKKLQCSYSGAIKNAIFPNGTYMLEVYGAQGGSTSYNGGKGGYAKGNKTLSSATTWYIVVGGAGKNCTSADSTNYDGGYNGGGNGGYTNGTSFANYVGSGGGATHISLQNAVLKSSTAANIIIVGGGGGGGIGAGNYTASGGAGGGTSGDAGTKGDSSYYGNGGTQTAGGTSSSGGPGSFGQGGNASSVSASSYGRTGGGGGWYGGGATVRSGGGGGSGYIGGVTGGSMTNGSRAGNGLAYITRNS